MEINYKKENTAKIAAYLRARSNEEVPVDGIMLNSGAERLPHPVRDGTGRHHRSDGKGTARYAVQSAPP